MKNHKVLLIALLLGWFIVNLVQATFTEIISDEAYYALYARYLAWGYFDHPPMVALLIKISSLFFSGSLGIRFLTVVLQLFTILLILKIIDENKPDIGKVHSFFIIVGSICVFSVYGFITTPDAPLIFFTALFLYAYKNFLISQSWKNITILSLSMAGLAYSKYHGVLVPVFVLLSNIRLLRNYRIWIAGIISIILFLPHLWWQAENGFPTFTYHLLDRSEFSRWLYILEYLPNQLAIYNPLILGAVIYVLVKNKAEDLYNRALYALIFGFLGFFWLTSLRGHVEPHWTAASVVPMIILLYKNSTVNPKMFRFLRVGVLPTLLLIILGRILFVSELPFVKYLGYAGKKEKYKYIESVAKELPVLFPGSYQGPSLYSFFTGKPSFAVNSLYSRKTQFDIWQFENKFHNKMVFICGIKKGESRLYTNGDVKFYGYIADSLQTVNRINVEVTPVLKTLHTGDSIFLSLILKSPYEYDIDFNHKVFPVGITMAFLKDEEIKLFPVLLKDPVKIIKSGELLERSLRVQVPDLPAGRYHFGICLQTIFGPAINNSFTVIKLTR